MAVTANLSVVAARGPAPACEAVAVPPAGGEPVLAAQQAGGGEAGHGLPGLQRPRGDPLHLPRPEGEPVVDLQPAGPDPAPRRQQVEICLYWVSDPASLSCRRCLTIAPDKRRLLVEECEPGNPRQVWQLPNYDPSKMEQQQDSDQ